ncbi:hypothetical protein SGQ44_16080 [Flavobacterium sp. Fl-77]|uniref:Uncharacterized protein n=1 Tax=Flavobacterium flavipigmentatum TaxID=2893884 RepID=A0AAJ2SJE8_9FLAO|nr:MULTISPECIES: hypothetical protein [unclassified Flavobacterium]MDX6183755.1 hypothetical protein [Flavobacterium sp. Fl-33]MDX6187284.1 hypothetical protein [Flavobacterium sp. Fl-77]UFH38099.1 hypothetical protein LNP22_15325 [Flavobacterium sp. F-70]
MTKSSQEKMLQKGVYTGIMEKDENNNYFCGEYLLDYKMAHSNHNIGDLITIKSIIENPSDMSYDKYPKKSKNFAKANLKPEQE